MPAQWRLLTEPGILLQPHGLLGLAEECPPLRHLSHLGAMLARGQSQAGLTPVTDLRDTGIIR